MSVDHRIPTDSLNPHISLPPAMTLPGPVTQTPSYRAARPQIVGAETPQEPFPIYLSGAVQKGFGRGGKDLGCPTGEPPSRTTDWPRLILGEQPICQTIHFRWWTSHPRAYTLATPRSLLVVPMTTSTVHLRVRSTRTKLRSTPWS